MNSLIRTLPTETTTVAEPNTLDFIATDETVDRYHEIISVDGWQLENYRRNPVFQNAHQYGDILFTLGRALSTEVRSVGGRRALVQRIEFATEANPMAKIAYGLYKGKFLNAVSVGFIPLKWEDLPAGKENKNGARRRYLEQELLEVSAVGIPANPAALQLGLKAGAVEVADLRQLADLLKAIRPARSARPATTLRNPATTSKLCGKPASHPNGTQLLQLARVLREVLRRA